MNSTKLGIVLALFIAVAVPRAAHANPGDVTMTFGTTIGSPQGALTLAKLTLSPGYYVLTGRFNVIFGQGAMTVVCHLGYDTSYFQASAGGATVGSAETPITVTSPFVVGSPNQIVPLTCQVTSNAGSTSSINYITLSAHQVNVVNFQ